MKQATEGPEAKGKDFENVKHIAKRGKP